MTHTLFQYYGIDWLASLMAVAMIWSLGNGQRIGFGFGIAANLSWIAFAAITGSVPILIANIIFVALNVRGWTSWASRHTAHQSQEQIA